MIRNAWELNENEMFELAKSAGNSFNVLTKTGKIKTVKTIRRKGMNGDYITFAGAEYLSIMEEWRYNQLKRANAIRH